MRAAHCVQMDTVVTVPQQATNTTWPKKESDVTTPLRLKFGTNNIIKRAIELRAVLDDVHNEDVINAALQVYVSEQIDEVVKRGLVSGPVTAVTPAENTGRATRRQTRG